MGAAIGWILWSQTDAAFVPLRWRNFNRVHQAACENKVWFDGSKHGYIKVENLNEGFRCAAMLPKKVLIIEDQASTRQYLSELVQIVGFRSELLEQKTSFLEQLRHQNPDLVLLGSCSSPGQVKAFADVVKREKKGIPILVINNSAKELKGEDRFGAAYSPISSLPQNFDHHDLKHAIEKLTVELPRSELKELDKMIIGQSPAVSQIKENIIRLSKSDVTVLITGESGTGKELVAQAIHRLSPRAESPFIKVNSAALPGNLLESELFGFEKGAFTGAWEKKPGKFKLAHSGSILLDEISEVPLPLQAKLLQVLEDNQLSSLGSTTSTKIDVRVLAATNGDLQQMVNDGGFRQDLYYRLNVVSVHLPPLRERREDIGLLADHLLEKHAARYGKKQITLKGSTRDLLYQYSWPGNVRELGNVIQSLTVLGNQDILWEKLGNHSAQRENHGDSNRSKTPQDGSTCLRQPQSQRRLKDVCKKAVRRAETDAILDVLAYTRWNRRKAAQLLQISYKGLLNKIKEYRIEEEHQNSLDQGGVSQYM
jgi:two-component system response regulator AtoC